MIAADHRPSLYVDFGKFLPKLASYVNYLFAKGFEPKTPASQSNAVPLCQLDSR